MYGTNDKEERDDCEVSVLMVLVYIANWAYEKLKECKDCDDKET